MCKSNMCKLNQQFNTLNLTIDLGKDIDDIIKSFNDEEDLGVCENCLIKDINNKDNFESCCESCNKVLCFSCYNDIETIENIKDDIICNIHEGEGEYLCYDCGTECMCGCERSFDEYSMSCFLDIDGDFVWYGNDCIHSKGLDMVIKDRENGYYTRNKFNPNCSEDLVKCCNCCNTNWEYEYNGDKEGQEKEDIVEDFEEMEEDEQEEEKENYDMVEVLHEETDFYNFYDNEIDCVNVVCENCCNLNWRYYG